MVEPVQPGTEGAPAAERAVGPGTPGGAASTRRVAGLTPGQWGGLVALVAVVQAPFVIYLARGSAPVTAAVPFQDDFDRAEIGENWFASGGHWRIEDGVLRSPGVKNNPLWLKARLPDEVVIEFDVRGESADGDIKVEVFGNGWDHASGYVLIFGGWSNTISIIARLDEHGPVALQPRGPRDRVENRTVKVEKGRTYRFRIERAGGRLKWSVDGRLLLEYADPDPLRGDGHDRFGFSSWDADLYFDNLSVVPL